MPHCKYMVFCVDSGDEEIDKWNLDDERIRLEESMAEVENEAEKEDEHKDKGDADEHGESVDFNIHGDTSHSSVKNNLGKFSTPLLKSNLLDTTSDNFTDAQVRSCLTNAEALCKKMCRNIEFYLIYNLASLYFLYFCRSRYHFLVRTHRYAKEFVKLSSSVD